MKALQHYAADGATVLAGQTWPAATAGVAQTARKYAIENVGDEAFTNLVAAIEQGGDSDGWEQFRWALDTATLSRPWGLAVVLGAPADGGVWASLATRGYRLTGTNATGQTVGSLEITIVIDDLTRRATVSWTALPGATGYKLYRTETPGTYGASTLRATIGSGATVSFVDDGSATTTGTPPATNTTGGAGPAYGTVPTLGITNLLFGAVAVGQQRFYWCNRVVPGSATGLGNPRLSQRHFFEG